MLNNGVLVSFCLPGVAIFFLFFTRQGLDHPLEKNEKVAFKALCSYHKHSNFSYYIFASCDCVHMACWTLGFVKVGAVFY